MKKFIVTLSTMLITSIVLAVPCVPVVPVSTPVENCLVYPSNWSKTVVNVKTVGAKGDGVTDDTAKIQQAVNQVTFGGELYFPAGTYRVNPNAAGYEGVVLKSNMTVRLDTNAVIKSLPSNKGDSSIFGIYKISNVNITGGTIIGDRSIHSNSIPNNYDTGMLLNINSSNNIFVENIKLNDAWGDAIYLGGNATPSKNVKICSVVTDNNRRQGISVTSANGFEIKNSEFKNTNGAAPQGGIDVEPDTFSPGVERGIISGNRFTDNKGYGILVYAGGFGAQPVRPIKDVSLLNNVVSGTGIGIAITKVDNATGSFGVTASYNEVKIVNNWAFILNQSNNITGIGNITSGTEKKPSLLITYGFNNNSLKVN